VSGGLAVIALSGGQHLHVLADTGADLDELTRFVDTWQSGRQGTATINARRRDGSLASESFAYRDVLRVDFPETASCGCEVVS
jgi:hypothetical protein